MTKVDGRQARPCSGAVIRLRRNHLTGLMAGRSGPNVGSYLVVTCRFVLTGVDWKGRARMTLEERLVRAHVQLEIISQDQHCFKAVALARHAAYEVRLVEFRQASSANAFAFWLELFDHNDRIAIDGGASNDLEEAVIFAEELIASAKELSEK
jgi:hypothetical protein